MGVTSGAADTGYTISVYGLWSDDGTTFTTADKVHAIELTGVSVGATSTTYTVTALVDVVPSYFKLFVTNDNGGTDSVTISASIEEQVD